MPLQKTQKKAELLVYVKFQYRILFRKIQVIHSVVYTILEKFIFVRPFLLAFAYMCRKIIVFLFFIQKRPREKDINFVYFIDEVWIKRSKNY